MSARATAAELSTIRHRFAEDVCFVAGSTSERIRAAFATVAREDFLGPGPWHIVHPLGGYWTTADDDPRHVYHNVVIAIDRTRGLNNGEPSLWARYFDALELAPGAAVLHVGCGTGYYSAILSEIVGPDGRVLAVEIDKELASRARDALGRYRRIDVRHADGSSLSEREMDAVIISAGATHVLPQWLDALSEGGRLAVPLTTDRRGGLTLLVTRRGERYAARSIGWIGIFSCAGGRNAEAEARLAAAIGKGHMDMIQSLRRDSHAADGACWLHGPETCVSMRPVH